MKSIYKFKSSDLNILEKAPAALWVYKSQSSKQKKTVSYLSIANILHTVSCVTVIPYGRTRKLFAMNVNNFCLITCKYL